jgi:hypothetical protein
MKGHVKRLMRTGESLGGCVGAGVSAFKRAVKIAREHETGRKMKRSTRMHSTGEEVRVKITQMPVKTRVSPGLPHEGNPVRQRDGTMRVIQHSNPTDRALVKT